ncbi:MULTISPECIES: hypothetical protein [Nostoc]
MRGYSGLSLILLILLPILPITAPLRTDTTTVRKIKSS